MGWEGLVVPVRQKQIRGQVLLEAEGEAQVLLVHAMSLRTDLRALYISAVCVDVLDSGRFTSGASHTPLVLLFSDKTPQVSNLSAVLQ